jgi:hypothetical protein
VRFQVAGVGEHISDILPGPLTSKRRFRTSGMFMVTKSSGALSGTVAVILGTRTKKDGSQHYTPDQFCTS